MSERLRESIARAVRELDYTPDLNARALASRQSSMVAVLIPAIAQNIFTDVLRGVYDGVEDSGLRIEIANTRYHPEVEERIVAELLRHRPAGVIISGVGQSAATRRMLEEAGCPVVQIMDSDRRPDPEDHRLLAFRRGAPDDRASDRGGVPSDRLPRVG